jgi:signal transduction histidine kinase
MISRLGKNIKTILTIRFTVIVAAILFVLSVLVFEFSNFYRDKEFNERLAERIKRKVNYLINTKEIDSSQLQTFYKLQLYGLPDERLTVITEYGKIVFSSDLLDANEMDLYEKLIHKKKFLHLRKQNRDYIAFYYPVGKENYYIIASAIDKIGYDKMHNLKLLLFFAFIIGLIIASLSGWYYANKALAPIKEIIYQVDKITANRLSDRVQSANENDEIGFLATRFNKMLERLEESFKLQKLFVANASHEFRTPLTAIKGQIEVLLLQSRNPDEYIETLSSIIEEINKQIQLLNALRDLSQAATINVLANASDIFVYDLISEAVDELRKLKPQYHINILTKNLPDDERFILTKGNSSLLRSCFINLMDNACKFSVNKKVQVLLEFNNTEIIIQFIDQGIGISEEDLKNIYEPFFRSNHTRNIAGFGIGLSLVKKVIDMHDGRIEITSKESEGTTVKIFLKNIL